MRRRSSSDAGVTLVEVLLTVVILGTAFVAILGGMGTSILASDIHRKQATAETVLRSYAEAAKMVTYAGCASSYSIAFAAPSGFTPSATAIDYWDPGTGTFSAACPSPDAGLQRLSLQVASSDGRATEKVQIVKRRP